YRYQAKEDDSAGRIAGRFAQTFPGRVRRPRLRRASLRAACPEDHVAKQTSFPGARGSALAQDLEQHLWISLHATANFSDPLREKKAETARPRFLIRLHSRNQPGGGNVRPRGQRADPRDQTRKPSGIPR